MFVSMSLGLFNKFAEHAACRGRMHEGNSAMMRTQSRLLVDHAHTRGLARSDCALDVFDFVGEVV